MNIKIAKLGGIQMPVLYEHSEDGKPYVIKSIKGQFVTYQSTADGFQILRKKGIGRGDRFNQHLLLELIRPGDAYTCKSGVFSVQPNKVR